MQVQKQSLRWRSFALLATFALLGFNGPHWVALATYPTLFRLCAAIFAVLASTGILGYAFGFRLGPIGFWRIASPAIVAFAVLRLVVVFVGALSAASPGDPIEPSDIAAMAVMAALFAAGCLALLRHADLAGATLLPTGGVSSSATAPDGARPVDERDERGDRIRLWVRTHPLATKLILVLVLVGSVLLCGNMISEVSHGKRIIPAIIAIIFASRAWKTSKARMASANGLSLPADEDSRRAESRKRLNAD